VIATTRFCYLFVLGTFFVNSASQKNADPWLRDRPILWQQSVGVFVGEARLERLWRVRLVLGHAPSRLN
jgi:hypothetical protein